jgi:hypothetical protein
MSVKVRVTVGQCYNHYLCDFCQFLVKKMAFHFCKTYVTITFPPQEKENLSQKGSILKILKLTQDGASFRLLRDCLL